MLQVPIREAGANMASTKAVILVRTIVLELSYPD